MRQNPVTVNEPFVCARCHKHNPKAQKTCRNHCRFCLFSVHVDESVPGDRKSRCKSLMEPVSIVSSGKKGFQIIHKCLKCGKKIANKLADDDNMDEVTRLMQKQNLSSLPNND